MTATAAEYGEPENRSRLRLADPVPLRQCLAELTAVVPWIPAPEIYR